MHADFQAETEEERQFYVEEAATIAERWSDDRDAIPLADVSACATTFWTDLMIGGEVCDAAITETWRRRS